MGYNLTIGELEVRVVGEGLEAEIWIEAEHARLENAPAFGEPTDYTNERWPSYSTWRDFAKFTGLEDFFYNKSTGVIREHPGCFPLKPEHKQIVDKAYEDFYKKNPDAKAGFSPLISEKDGIFDDPNWPQCNGYAVRLEWLKFWIDWAIENCANPVFENS